MRKIALLFGIAAVASGSVVAADPATIDWSKVPATTMTLFYPGQSSHEWLTSDHKGAKGVKAVKSGLACVKCHEGDEKQLGASLVKGGTLEPRPVKDKPGSLELKVQAVYDAKNAYLRFQWKTRTSYPGCEHPYLRYDGKQWKGYGYPKLDPVVQEGKQLAIYEDRFAIMIDDGKVPAAMESARLLRLRGIPQKRQ